MSRAAFAAAAELLLAGGTPDEAGFAALAAEGLRAENAGTRARLTAEAVRRRRAVYGTDVYARGLIEISNHCRNDCRYCGIRRSNAAAERYRLTPDAICACAATGYAAGLRTFVLQGGEDAFFTDDELAGVIRDVKRDCPGAAVTLSLGERGRASFARLRAAGADRYLLRHETADAAHYGFLHPPEMRFAARIQALHDLRACGYQTGCGFMVGSPGQTPATLAKDLAFIAAFKPEMCGIGPFVPHHATPFAACPAGSVELTCFLLSVIRLVHPTVLLPATTALGTLASDGREKGVLAGANVVMPNLTPAGVRARYEIYDNKISTGAESAEGLADLARRLAAVGYRLSLARGDCRARADGAGGDVLYCDVPKTGGENESSEN